MQGDQKEGTRETVMPKKRPCKTRTGPRGGKYRIVRKRGGGTRKEYESEKKKR